ncbi:MAG: flagellar export chaperone FlgN [Chloroflexi bacterium]|nr:flagellar export chaperone FlgN [Chloroflexota bacterium]
MVSEARLAELEATLTALVPALDHLLDAQAEQHRVLVIGDLSAIVAANATIEAASARVTNLEQRRQGIQADLEAELGVRGLRAALDAAVQDAADRHRRLVLLDQIAAGVLRLRAQSRQNSELLGSAIDLARRTRVTFERLSGVDATYTQVKARLLAARRAMPEATPAMAAGPHVKAQTAAAQAAAPAPAALPVVLDGPLVDLLSEPSLARIAAPMHLTESP